MMAAETMPFPQVRDRCGSILRKCGDTRKSAVFLEAGVGQNPHPGSLARSRMRTGFNPSPFQGVDNKPNMRARAA